MKTVKKHWRDEFVEENKASRWPGVNEAISLLGDAVRVARRLDRNPDDKQAIQPLKSAMSKIKGELKKAEQSMSKHGTGEVITIRRNLISIELATRKIRSGDYKNLVSILEGNIKKLRSIRGGPR